MQIDMTSLCRIHLTLKVASVEQAQRFYCEDLGLFDFYYDYGMDTVSLVFKRNPTVFLILSAGRPIECQDYTFALQAKDCKDLFHQLSNKPFVTQGRLLSEELFEYPLGANFMVQDPSGNKVLIFDEVV
jgi:hypothetical protein